MKYLGVYGLLLGGSIGLLCALLTVLIVRPAPPPNQILPPAIAPDITVFISERSLTRIAAETIQRPTAIDFEANGRMTVITRLPFGWLEPVVHFGLFIEMQGTAVVSELEWMQVGFLTIPARFLPQTLIEGSQNIGSIIKQQIPPDFALVGLATSAEGVTFQLKWVGR